MNSDEPLDRPPSVHRWPDLGWAGDYVAQMSSQGWRPIRLDTSLRWDKRGFLAASRSAFGFPDWFGMNWDALADSLGDVPVPTPGLLVTWTGWGAMARMYPSDFAVATDILAEWVEHRPGPGPRVVLVALVGAGPVT